MIRAGLSLALALSAGAATAYRAGPPPGHTGAFGEPDCGECHFDALRDDDRGAVAIRAPARYEPGRGYRIRVELHHPRVPTAGFQLSARFADGARAGQQAGALEPGSDRTLVQTRDEVEYASHSAAGSTPEQPDAATWTIHWTAPPEGGTVALDVAAQVGNDDDSEFGERIYLARRMVAPSDKER